jgi:hypothetical protein
MSSFCSIFKDQDLRSVGTYVPEHWLHISENIAIFSAVNTAGLTQNSVVHNVRISNTFIRLQTSVLRAHRTVLKLSRAQNAQIDTSSRLRTVH